MDTPELELSQIDSFSKEIRGEEVITFKAVGATVEDPSRWTEGTMSTTGDPWIEMPALLFYTGRHKGQDWTEDRLQRLANNFSEPKGEMDWTVPGQLDHSESARDTTGHLRKVWKSGKNLWGIVRHIGKEAVQNAKNGIWKKLSLGIYSSRDTIREYSITPFPHLTHATTFSETTEPESEEPMADTPTKQSPPAPTPPAPPASPEPVTNFAEFQAQMEARFAAKTAELEARLAKSEQKNEEQGKSSATPSSPPRLTSSRRTARHCP